MRIKRNLILLLLFTFGVAHSAFAAQSQHVLIAYYSKSHHTEYMAKAIAKGAKSVSGTDVKFIYIDKKPLSSKLAKWADALIIGSPVYNAAPAYPVVRFIDSLPFNTKLLHDKIGAAFASGAGAHAGAESTVLSILRSEMLLQMVTVGGENWNNAFGAIGTFPTNADEKLKASYEKQALAESYGLGRRVALLLQHYHRA